MGFEVYERPVGNKNQHAEHATIHKGGHISIPAAAFEAAGKPRSVTLLYDRETGTIALRPGGGPDSYRISGYSGTTNRKRVYARSFLEHYNVAHTEMTTRTWRWDGEMLLIEEAS
jgi:hypothetical protein